MTAFVATVVPDDHLVGGRAPGELARARGGSRATGSSGVDGTFAVRSVPDRVEQRRSR